jgi:hypothetical protein
MNTNRQPYRTREDCTNLMHRLTSASYPPLAMLVGGKELFQAAACEEAYYVSADACGIPETEAHDMLQGMAAAPTTPRDYRDAWSRLLNQHFADAP